MRYKDNICSLCSEHGRPTRRVDFPAAAAAILDESEYGLIRRQFLVDCIRFACRVNGRAEIGGLLNLLAHVGDDTTSKCVERFIRLTR